MDYVDIFTQAEQAGTIATGVVVPGGIRADKVLEGAEREAIHIHDWRGDSTRWNSCVPRHSKGSRVLVFVDDDKRFVAHYQSVLSFDQRAEDRAALEDALVRWLAADNDVNKLELLIALSSGTDERLAREASMHLIDRVEWFDDITGTHKEALRKALAGGEKPNEALGWLLVRLGDRRSGKILSGFLGTSPLLTSKRLGVEFLEHRHDGEIASRDELAEVIENGPETTDRIAAFDRCEREWGRSLYRFSRYRFGVAERFWKILAKACRKGETVQGILAHTSD